LLPRTARHTGCIDEGWEEEMETVVALGTVISGIGIGLGTARLVLQGILAMTFGRARS
jgi:hypothetical protein